MLRGLKGYLSIFLSAMPVAPAMARQVNVQPKCIAPVSVLGDPPRIRAEKHTRPRAILVTFFFNPFHEGFPKLVTVQSSVFILTYDIFQSRSLRFFVFDLLPGWIAENQ